MCNSATTVHIAKRAVMKRYSKQSELSLQEATTEELVSADSNERMFKWAIRHPLTL